VPHVAKGILELLMLGEKGVFHVVNNGSTTWHAFATELFRLSAKTTAVDEIETDKYPMAAQRHYTACLLQRSLAQQPEALCQTGKQGSANMYKQEKHKT
jgi:dTDP-4-dehydrorhamnose reductase